MDPLSTVVISAAATRIVNLIEWDKVLHGLADDAAKTGAKRLFGRLRPTEQQKTARIAIALFLHEWDSELEDKTPFAAAIPGYRDQLQRLLEAAAPDIVAWLNPETAQVDLAPVERTWNELARQHQVSPLPEGFDWTLVAQNYSRAIRKHIKSDPELRAVLVAALQERTANATERTADAAERAAGPDPGFNLSGYRDYLQKKCGALQLAVMHTSAHHFDRQITLWSVFVPQLARESAPLIELPEEIRRRLREEGQLAQGEDAEAAAALQQRYQSAALTPVLDILQRERLAVVTGNPGSGKTSLLKYLALRWVNEDHGLLPLFIDLREYIREREGVPEYFESGWAMYRLDARQLDQRLKEGAAVLFFDGLDEIFDAPSRASVIDEIAALASRYPKARMVVTSRKLGYKPERLQAAGFAHATLEDFDDDQVRDFLTRWHKIAEDDPKERTRLQTRIERAIADSTAIRELAGNPLLLTMMAILNRNQELPRDRVELYREASRVLLGEWDASRALPADEFARQEKEALLRELAGDMQQLPGGLAGNLIDRDRLIDRFRKFLAGLGVQDSYQKALVMVEQLTKRNFILSFAGVERFSFVHRTFLEYYCAAWFVDRFEKKQELSLEELKTEVFGRHWKDEKWQEVLRLIAGMIEEKKAEELILYLMSLEGGDAQWRNLLLAAGCVSEVRNRRAVEATSKQLLKRMVEDAAANVRSTEVAYNPYVMEKARRAAFSTIAQVWRSEGANAWLKSVAIESDEEIVRVAAVEEVARGWRDDPDTLPWLKDRVRSDKHWSVQQAAVAVVASGWKDDPDTLPWLKDQAGSEDWAAQGAALWEMARGWRDEPDTLPWLKDQANSKQSSLRQAALAVLAAGWKEDPEVLPLLKKRARSDEDEGVRRTALQALAEGWKDDPEVLPLLRDRARCDEVGVVRYQSMELLVRHWKDDPEVLPILKDRAHSDESELVRYYVLHEMASNWKAEPEVLRLLKDRARSDEKEYVRKTALGLLAESWPDDPEVQAMFAEQAKASPAAGH